MNKYQNQTSILLLACFTFVGTLSLSGCDIGKLTVNTTSKVLERGQPAIKQESDFLLAERAIPASLKTVEAFHMVDSGNLRLKRILAEGFCQYASGFIEDEWEIAQIKKDFESIEEHSIRASKSFIRCMGYGAEMIGEDFIKTLWGDTEVFLKKVRELGPEHRDGLMWASIGLAGMINHNKDDQNVISHLTKAKETLEIIVTWDDASPPKDSVYQALPHLALGLAKTALSKEFNGDPEGGRKNFERALALTNNKFLLAKVYLARRYAIAVQNQGLFHQTLINVLQTDPAIWPEQRLANEIAHRRAKRYLKQEKEWF